MSENIPYGVSERISPEHMKDFMLKALAGLGEVIILDENGHMVYISEEYARNMKISIEDSLDKHIAEIIPDTVLPTVLKSGKAILGDTYYRNGDAFFVNRIPLKENGKTVGVVAQAILNSRLASERATKGLSSFVRELNYYKEKYQQLSAPRSTLDSIVGSSPVMRDLKDTLRMVSGTRSSVLITGESGTGKEVFAGALHNLGGRRDKPFIRLNCAAIPDNLLESELFGYEEGAFTGAVKGGKIGDFEAANGGTLFLDEVDSLSPNMQAKLLRVIQEREIKKVGSTKTIPIDVRFVFATNKDLYQMMKAGEFREDFYYRINVIHLRLPPLRERREDILPLVNRFVEKFNQELDRQVTGLTPAAMMKLENYDWPGNIRELENCIERAFNYVTGPVIDVQHITLPGVQEEQLPGITMGCTLKEARDHAEKVAIRQMLQICGGNKKETAERLGIDRSILYDKIKRYGL